MNFRKNFEIGGRGGHFKSKKCCCKFSAGRHEFQKKSQHFSQKRAGGGVKGRLEVFQKFIDNGTDGRPLVLVMMRKMKMITFYMSIVLCVESVVMM